MPDRPWEDRPRTLGELLDARARRTVGRLLPVPAWAAPLRVLVDHVTALAPAGDRFDRVEAGPGQALPHHAAYPAVAIPRPPRSPRAPGSGRRRLGPCPLRRPAPVLIPTAARCLPTSAEGCATPWATARAERPTYCGCTTARRRTTSPARTAPTP